LNGVTIPEVSAGSNHVGASEMWTPQVTCPSGAASAGATPALRLSRTKNVTDRPRVCLTWDLPYGSIFVHPQTATPSIRHAGARCARGFGQNDAVSRAFGQQHRNLARDESASHGVHVGPGRGDANRSSSDGQRRTVPLRSPTRSRGAKSRNAIWPISVTTVTCKKAYPQPLTDMPPERSRIHPIAIGPTNPPAYPAIECTARVAPRRWGSALPAAPAVSDEESSQISRP